MQDMVARCYTVTYTIAPSQSITRNFDMRGAGYLERVFIDPRETANPSNYRGAYFTFVIRNEYVNRDYFIPAYDQRNRSISVESFRTAEQPNPLIFDPGLFYSGKKRLELTLNAHAALPAGCTVNMVLLCYEQRENQLTGKSDIDWSADQSIHDIRDQREERRHRRVVRYHRDMESRE